MRHECRKRAAGVAELPDLRDVRSRRTITQNVRVRRECPWGSLRRWKCLQGRIRYNEEVTWEGTHARRPNVVQVLTKCVEIRLYLFII